MNCSINSKRLGSWLFCNLTVTKYGSPRFDYLTEIDFGNNFTQEARIMDTNSSTQSFVAMYKNQYEYPDDYDVYFYIPSLNYTKFIMTVEIAG